MAFNVEKANAFICAVCGRIHMNPTSAEKRVAGVWGFFVCGMAELPHKDESYVRRTMTITEDSRSVRIDLFTGQRVS